MKLGIISIKYEGSESIDKIREFLKDDRQREVK
jgi:hypothetical protein